MKKQIVFCALLAMALFSVPGISQARWLSVDTGRFMTMDTFPGDQQDPQSLHKYVYAADNPVNLDDPSGKEYGDFDINISSIGGLLARIGSPVTSESGLGVFASYMPRASSKTFWAAYQQVDYDIIPPEQNVKVWQKVGGNIGAKFGPIAENSCATRVSWGLNYGGAQIPKGTLGAWHNFTDQSYDGKKGDNKYYIINAGNMNKYLTSKWGPPNYPQVGTVPQLGSIVASLQQEQCAIFATRQSPGHSGVLKQGYQDPYVDGELPLDVWSLALP